MNTDITKQMEMILYRTEDDSVTVSALIKDESIWITQKAMAELFGIDKSGISRHLAKIFETGELKEEVVVAKIATTTQHGAVEGKTQTKDTNYYNLDAIISVGYRVNSIKATQFRIWATSILKEYMIKGFAMDDERLKLAKTAFLKDNGKISHQQALEKAYGEYDIYNKLQPIESDFDRIIENSSTEI